MQEEVEEEMEEEEEEEEDDVAINRSILHRVDDKCYRQTAKAALMHNSTSSGRGAPYTGASAVEEDATAAMR